ncbi:ATP-binding cassette domain-containing protein [Pantoea agglomerans]|uniref:ATP-binding cassette domain-containing protein n=1 Tax=Enterobacter agglomerans TaxID=549 RepID=UPI000DAC58E3|nr:ATP-binding cassette domain-containing protein [Pantoea agglomerans]RAH27352.1 macrolide ABC transporter permease/ATP-binding protein MacB [Pantoea agglomerans]TGX89355.1 ATP-binding cassette domain-containing protein [Pantoea agglomerans]
MKNIIELKSVCREFLGEERKIKVLKNINLKILSGQYVAITGPSGSGKSTLLNIIGCLDKPSSGDCYINGQNLSQLSFCRISELRRVHIGFIFQRYNLIKNLTAIENVELPLIYSGIRRDARSTRASELLDKVGLKGREHHKPSELSGGQQQRVSIARALVNGAEVILADEPTGALDSEAGNQVLELLKKLNELGHTVILITHDLSVANHAQRIIHLNDGVIESDKIIKETQLVKLSPVLLTKQNRWKNFTDKLYDSIKMAFMSTISHRLRTALTMIGIVFGLAAVVTVVALGDGAKNRTLEKIQNLGVNLVGIYPGKDYLDSNSKNIDTLTLRDAVALTKQSFIDSISPEINGSNKVRFKDKAADASINGVGKEYFRVNGIVFLEGKNFSDDRNALQEVIIDEKGMDLLFDESDTALGNVIFIGSVPAKIIAIVKSNDRDFDSDHFNVWMPYSAVMYRIVGKTSLDSISVRLKDNIDSSAAVKAITELLLNIHHSKDFHIFDFSQIRNSIEFTSKVFNFLIIIVAFVSLLVGSIGLMNVMLISVAERTYEIGIRIAIGARQRDIMWQFMIEAIMICVVGGFIGIFLSYLLVEVLNLTAGEMLHSSFSWSVAMLAFFFSNIIGLTFGYLPSRKAAQMNPVAAFSRE